MSYSYFSQFATPCYLFDCNEFKRSIIGFRDALATKFKKIIIGYSFKTNSLPYAIKTAKSLGCYAEVVSFDEYKLARLCGYEPNRIIYNGPMKSRETFMEAIRGGAIVNLETKRELEWLKEYDGEEKVNVGLRLNIDLNQINPEELDGHDGCSRFGFSEESNEFEHAIAQLADMPRVNLVGIHTHRSTATRSVQHYSRTVEFACQVIRKYNLHLEYFDVGGGFFGIFPNKPTFTDYTDAIYNILAKYNLENLELIIEPGCAILASSFKFITRVIDVKKINQQTIFLTTDGSRNDVDPLFRKSGYLKDIFRATATRETVPAQIVAGCSCMEDDRLFTVSDEHALDIDDIIVYNNVGAYTMTLSPNFIRFMPRVYAIDNDCNIIEEVRRAGNAEDILMA